MDLNYLRRLVKVFDDSKATDLEIIEEGITIRLSQNLPINEISHSQMPMYSMPQYIQAPQSTDNQSISQIKSIDTSLNIDSHVHTIPISNTSYMHEVKSPIVGTFYRAPSPDSPSYVEIGSRVKAGDVLCIIEAMKLMNEIECDISGIVEKISLENGTPVEYNQLLFVIKPD